MQNNTKAEGETAPTKFFKEKGDIAPKTVKLKVPNCKL